jgi:uncharacterized repeat protein (TIGR02543 family)
MKSTWRKRILSTLMALLLLCGGLPLFSVPSFAATTHTLNSQTYSGRYLQVSLTQTKDPANRRSKITGTVTSLAGTSTWYTTGPTTVTVAGTQRYYRAQETSGNGQSNRNFVGTIPEFYVSHDSAGNASVSVSITTAIYYFATETKSNTWTLDSIGPATSTVTYNANGGSVSLGSATVNTGSATTLPTPSRTGYTFSGWYTASSGGTRVGGGGSSYTVSANTTLYAQWTPNTYTITYNGNGNTGGSAPAPQSIAYDGILTHAQLGSLTKTGYTADGWALSPSGNLHHPFGGQLQWRWEYSETHYAHWVPNTYIVSYNGNGGSGTTASSSHTYGTAKALTSNGFTRTGYTFLGWSTSSSATSATYTNGQSVSNLSSTNGATVTLYAVWQGIPYNVAYNANGGSGTTANTSHVYGTGSALRANAFTRTGYTFAGWATSAGGAVAYSNSANVSTLTSTSGATVTLYAVWTINAYTVTYNANGGSVSPSSAAVNYNSATTLPTPTRTGYAFKGWYTAASGGTLVGNASASYTVTAAITLYAQWTANTYTVNYNANGGTGATASSSHTYDVAKALTTNGFSRMDYEFSGWSTSSTATSATYTNVQSVSNLTSTNNGTVTLYAVWLPNTSTQYKLQIYHQNANDDNYSLYQTITLSGTAGNAAPNPSSNYSYTGFTFNSGYSGNVTTGTISSSLVLKLYYTRNTYTLTLNANGGSVNPTSVTQKHGATYTLPTPTRTGYSFGSWSLSGSGSLSGNTYTFSTAAGTVTANWTAYTYTVNYNANGGTGSTTSSSHTYGASKALTANGFSRTGYTFLGWSTSSTATSATYRNGQSVSNLTSTNNGTVTLYAVWAGINYTVAYNANGGTGGMASSAHVYGTAKALTANAFVRPGYTFKGWSTVVNPALNAAINYTNGQSVTNLSVTDGATIILYAVWTVNTNTPYKAELYLQNANDNNFSLADTKALTGTTDTTASVTGTTYTVANGTFYSGYSGNVLSGSISGDGTLVLKVYYTRNTFNLTVNQNGGTGGAASQNGLRWGQTINLGAPTKTGYTLSGWTVSGTGASVAGNTLTMGTTNTTATANWNANQYIVTLNPDGGTVDPSTISVWYDSTYGGGSELPAPERKGHVFDGWYTAINGGGTSVTKTTLVKITAHQTIYAKWLANNKISRPITNYGGGYYSAEVEGAHAEPFNDLYIAHIDPPRAGFPKEAIDPVNPLFEVYLRRNGLKVAPVGPITVRLPFDRTGSTTAGLLISILHYDDKKELLEPIIATSVDINGDKYLEFETTTFGYFQPKYSLAFYDYLVYQQAEANGFGSSPEPLLEHRMYANETFQLMVGDGAGTYDWSILNDTGLVTLSQQNDVATLTAKMPTSNTPVEIFAKDRNTEANIVITVLPQSAIIPTGITLNKTREVLQLENALTLIPTITPSNATNKTVTWESSNTAVAKVDGNGYVYACGLGTATITATTVSGGKTASCEVEMLNDATPYKVTFNYQGATGGNSAVDKTVYKGKTYGELPTPTRTGWSFNGWYTASTGGTKITSTDIVNISANQILYAQWIGNPFTVIFDYQGATGGNGTPNKPVTNGGVYGELPTPTRTNYNFTGWYTATTGGSPITAASTVNLTANQTLYARWTPVVDNSALNTRINTIGSTAKGDYTDKSWSAFQAALSDARSVAGNASATQAQVDAALNALNAAYNGLAENKNYFHLWGKTTKWEKTPLNWFLCIVLFGWIWMAF